MPLAAGFAAALLTGAALLAAAELVAAAEAATEDVPLWLAELTEAAGADPVALAVATLVAAGALDGGAAELAPVLTEAAPPQAASRPAAAPPLKSTRQPRRERRAGPIGFLRFIGSRRMAIHVGVLATSIYRQRCPVNSTTPRTRAAAWRPIHLSAASDGAAVAGAWRRTGRELQPGEKEPSDRKAVDDPPVPGPTTKCRASPE
jgi:hypothetical protein